MRLRPAIVALITCLALADLAGAVWLWSLWQGRSAPAQPKACLDQTHPPPAADCR